MLLLISPSDNVPKNLLVSSTTKRHFSAVLSSVFIAFFIGIPSYLLVRKIWKVIKRRICVKDLENEIDEEFDEDKLHAFQELVANTEIKVH